jgi:hypothetical protein
MNEYEDRINKVKYSNELSGDVAEEAFVETVLVILFIAIFVSLACCSEYINDVAVADNIELQGE